MSSIRVFPQHLPAALVAGHGFEPQPNARQRERDQGEMRLRPRWRSVPEHASVTWLLDQDGFDAFDAWFEDSLKAGTGDFDVRVQHRGTQWGTTWYTAMFLGGVYGCDVVPSATGLMYRVTASLQLIEELGPVRVSPGITATLRVNYSLTARTTPPTITALLQLDYGFSAAPRIPHLEATMGYSYTLTATDASAPPPSQVREADSGDERETDAGDIRQTD